MERFTKKLGGGGYEGDVKKAFKVHEKKELMAKKMGEYKIPDKAVTKSVERHEEKKRRESKEKY